MTGPKNGRIGDNVQKHSALYNTYNVNFSHCDRMYNTLTIIVLPDKEFLISLTLQPLIKEVWKICYSERGRKWINLEHFKKEATYPLVIIRQSQLKQIPRIYRYESIIIYALAFYWYICTAMQYTLHKKWSFSLRIYPVNVTKSTWNCGFGHIFCRDP